MSSNEATRTLARRDAVARVLPRPGVQPERRLRGRAFALLWGAGTILVTTSLLAPGGESDEPAALTVGAVSLAYALALFLGAGRLPRWSFDVAVGVGTGLVSVLVWRSGGAISSFAPLYVWELAFAAAFLPLWRTALQCLLAAAGYVAAIDLADADAPTERVVIVLATLLIVPGLVAAVRAHVDQLVDDLDLQATTDPLTGLANRRALSAAIERERARDARTHRSLSVVVLDLDHFKAVNDRFGHPVGDRALTHVADVLRSGCRAADIAARTGGEEFALLLPETDGPAALLIAERVRAEIARSTTSDGVRLTASFGVAQNDGSDLLTSADGALYRAKAAGRDRCELANSKPT